MLPRVVWCGVVSRRVGVAQSKRPAASSPVVLPDYYTALTVARNLSASLSSSTATPVPGPGVGVSGLATSGCHVPIMETGKLGGAHLAVLTDFDDGDAQSPLGSPAELLDGRGCDVEGWLGFPDPSKCACGEGKPHRRSDATVVDWSVRGPAGADRPPSILDARCATGLIVLEDYYK